jgi:hypothetical protein
MVLSTIEKRLYSIERGFKLDVDREVPNFSTHGQIEYDDSSALIGTTCELGDESLPLLRCRKVWV